MSIYKCLVAVSGLVTLAGCSHGLRPESFPPAISASGAAVTLRVLTEGQDRTGELFASDSSGLIVLGDRLFLVRWDQLTHVAVRKLDAYRLEHDRTVPDETRKQLALISRYPHGLKGDRLAEVLAALKQPALESVGVPTAPTEARRPDHESFVDANTRESVVNATSLDSLADAAANMSARYADRRVAIADGYRRIGTDFPGMGEHWVNVGTLLSGRLDAARPTMLVYATVFGVPKLMGVGFILTTAGDANTTSAPGWPAAWHEHSGLIDDESAGRAPRRPEADATQSTRVWVLHIWTSLANPAGRYVADNWALPFARAGLAPPARVEAEAGRALSLTVGGDAFLAALLADAGLVGAPEARHAVDSLVAVAMADAQSVAQRAALRGSRDVSEGEIAALRATWGTLERRLVAVLGPEVRHYMRPGRHH